ncbi:MAG TPA: sugar phosphate isomerase/epimerase family protein [Gemmatimonadales bacterium]|jgi:sugar phosphate isomerase/epimerase|nr:sugar phosphate isomerase/epimerase family protein [Gemmatimonadales bacterium]
MTTRREFLQTSAAMLAVLSSPPGPLSLRERGNEGLRLGFSTLGCPNWTWPQILDFAAGHRFAAIELRGILTNMDLTKVPEFAPDRLAEAKRQLAAHGLSVTCLGASAQMHDLDPVKHAAQLDDGRRFIDLAQALGAPYVRVFGNEYVKGVPRADMLAHIAEGLRTLGDYAKPKNVTVIIESHGDFTDSTALLEILQKADSPQVALLWDAHHTFVSGKEEPEDTVRQLGRYIRHTHLKDSVPAGNDRRYVLTGTGEVPVKRQIEALEKIGYKGFYSFEWEKRWHPEIEEPEVAFAQYASVAAAYLRQR